MSGCVADHRVLHLDPTLSDPSATGAWHHHISISFSNSAGSSTHPLRSAGRVTCLSISVHYFVLLSCHIRTDVVAAVLLNQRDHRSAIMVSGNVQVNTHLARAVVSEKEPAGRIRTNQRAAGSRHSNSLAVLFHRDQQPSRPPARRDCGTAGSTNAIALLIADTDAACFFTATETNRPLFSHPPAPVIAGLRPP